MFDWMRAKWAALSRLPSDEPHKPHLPFTDEHSRFRADTVEAMAQEARMLEAAQDGKPTDTPNLRR